MAAPSNSALYFRQYRAARRARGGRLLTHEERSAINQASSPQKTTGYRAHRRERAEYRRTHPLKKELA